MYTYIQERTQPFIDDQERILETKDRERKIYDRPSKMEQSTMMNFASMSLNGENKRDGRNKNNNGGRRIKTRNEETEGTRTTTTTTRMFRKSLFTNGTLSSVCYFLTMFVRSEMSGTFLFSLYKYSHSNQ